MSNSVFARKELLKHGWTEGSGLGKEQSGIKEAIKVKIKNDNTGVGHDPGKEFTCHWWDDVFNRAASSITVETTQEGVEIKKSAAEEKQRAKTLNNKSLLYSGFVKGAVLQASDKKVMTEISCHDSSDSDSDDSEASKAISIKLTEEELFTRCEGRTAHKGARHGLKQNAKLLRIQQQEQLLLEERAQTSCNKTLNKVAKSELDCEKKIHGLARSDVWEKNSSYTCTTVPKKKARKKCKERYKDIMESEVCDEMCTSANVHNDNVKDLGSNNIETEDVRKKKHKKSKRKREMTERDDENPQLTLGKNKKGK